MNKLNQSGGPSVSNECTCDQNTGQVCPKTIAWREYCEQRRQAQRFLVGANYTSNDGKRQIVINREVFGQRDRTFIIRNVKTGRCNRIELPGLTRKYRFTGYDPEYLPA